MRKNKLCVFLIILTLLSACQTKNFVYKKTEQHQIFQKMVLAAIDSKSMSKLGEMPWKRSAYADFLSRLMDKGKALPGFVFFDIYFLTKKNKKTDNLLANAFKAINGDYIDYHIGSSTDGHKSYSEKLLQLLKTKTLPDQDGSFIELKNMMLPIYKYARYVDGFAPAVLDPGEDIKKTFPLFVKVPWKNSTVGKKEKRIFPNIVMLLIMRHFRIGMNDLKLVPGEYVQLNNALINNSKDRKTVRIPFEKGASIKLLFTKNKWQHISFSDILNKPALAKTMKDKYIFTGLYEQSVQSSDRNTDFWPTPVGRKYGVEIMMHAFTTALRTAYIVGNR